MLMKLLSNSSVFLHKMKMISESIFVQIYTDLYL